MLNWSANLLTWSGVILIGLDLVSAAVQLKNLRRPIGPRQTCEGEHTRTAFKSTFSTRLTIFAMAYLVSAFSDKNPPRHEYLAIGTILIIVGLAVRSMAIAHETSGRHLVTSGFYLYLRHPRYWGTSLIIMGFVLMHPAAVNLALGALLICRYVVSAREEEIVLTLAFAEEYESYRQHVPAIVPSLRWSPLRQIPWHAFKRSSVLQKVIAMWLSVAAAYALVLRFWLTRLR